MRELSIGRNGDNDIVVDDASVSRKHAVLIISGNEYSVRDIGSSNGTYINGMRITGVSNLRKNDILKVGNALVPWMNHLEMAGYKQETVVRQQPQQQQYQQQQQYHLGGQENVPNSVGAMVCGIIGVLLSIWGIIGLIGLALSIVGLALGVTGVGKYKRNPDQYTRSSFGQANAGMILGIIGISLFLLMLFFALMIAGSRF